MRVAAFDLGTNVFNLIIGDFRENGEYEKIAEKKSASRIGDTITGGMLTEESLDRAVHALDPLFKETADRNVPAGKTIICCTSAIREASNGKDFVKKLGEKYGADFTIISGEREAELIYKGVADSLPKVDGTFMIMDIGGGSNEFIIADAEGMKWKHSFKLGMSRLKNMFHPSEPIKDSEIEDVENYSDDNLAELWEAVGTYRPATLIGTSGSFDTFRDILTGCKNDGNVCMEIKPEELSRLHERLKSLDREERLAIPGMSAVRVDYIVLASAFTMFILRKTGIRNIMQSSYSLKEGVLAEIKYSIKNGNKY